jgi:hypothetical protein
MKSIRKTKSLIINYLAVNGMDCTFTPNEYPNRCFHLNKDFLIN